MNALLRRLLSTTGIGFPAAPCLVAVVILGSAGCQTTTVNYADLDPPPIPTREMSLENEYRLEAGDRLMLRFPYNEELNDNVLVGPDGRASLLLIGEVMMQGQTIPELQAELVRRYDDYLTDPVLALSLSEVSTQRVFVGGEVARPGMYESTGGLTLMQAIFMAGGYTKVGDLGSVVVLRDSGEPVLDYYIMDIGENLSTLAGIQDLRLQGRDIVYVPKTPVGSINQFLNVHLAGVKEVLSLFNFTVTYELRDTVELD